MARKNLSDADALRKELEAPWLSDWKLAKLRRERKISFTKIGWRTILYDAEKVRAALDQFETQEVR
jgi:hypothetical protein